MYELQEERIRRTAAEADTLLFEDRVRVENTLRDSRHEEHQTMERMRQEARSFVVHESNAFGVATTQNHDLFSSLNDANTRNAELEQR